MELFCQVITIFGKINGQLKAEAMFEAIDSEAKLRTPVNEPVLEDLLPIIIDMITEIGINKAEFVNFRNEILEKLCKAQSKQEKVEELLRSQSIMQKQIENLMDENKKLSEQLRKEKILCNHENQNTIISKLKELLINFETNWNSQKEFEYENFVTKDTFYKLLDSVNQELHIIKDKQENDSHLL